MLIGIALASGSAVVSAQTVVNNYVPAGTVFTGLGNRNVVCVIGYSFSAKTEISSWVIFFIPSSLTYLGPTGWLLTTGINAGDNLVAQQVRGRAVSAAPICVLNLAVAPSTQQI